jgi:RNA polymerase sigma-70 factor (ECF subfamily)
MSCPPSPERAIADEQLARLAQCGDALAFTALLRRYERRIYRLAARMSRNASDAEEITQETFLRALRGVGSFQGESCFGAWLHRIAINEALMRRRAARRRPTESLEAVHPRFADLGVPGPTPEARADDLLDSKAVVRRVREALARLDEKQRAALVLRDLEGLSAQEAARVLGTSPEAVRQRAHRARVKLGTWLADLSPVARDALPPLPTRGSVRVNEAA